MVKNQPLEGKSNLVTGSIIAVILAALPYIFYFYETVPTDGWGIEAIQAVTKPYGNDATVAFWIIFNKILPLILMFFWFFTCKHWWYHAILIPLFLYVFQFVTAIAPNVQFIDHDEIFFMIPVVVVCLSLAYLARTKIFDKVHGIDISEIEDASLKRKYSAYRQRNDK